MSESEKVPKDLGLKIGTPKEALWTTVKKQTQQVIDENTKSLEIQNEILKLADRIISMEKQKFKYNRNK